MYNVFDYCPGLNCKTMSVVTDKQLPGKGGWVVKCGILGPKCGDSVHNSATFCDLGQIALP